MPGTADTTWRRFCRCASAWAGNRYARSSWRAQVCVYPLEAREAVMTPAQITPEKKSPVSDHPVVAAIGARGLLFLRRGKPIAIYHASARRKLEFARRWVHRPEI